MQDVNALLSSTNNGNFTIANNTQDKGQNQGESVTSSIDNNQVLSSKLQTSFSQNAQGMTLANNQNTAKTELSAEYQEMFAKRDNAREEIRNKYADIVSYLEHIDELIKDYTIKIDKTREEESRRINLEEQNYYARGILKDQSLPGSQGMQAQIQPQFQMSQQEPLQAPSSEMPFMRAPQMTFNNETQGSFSSDTQELPKVQDNPFMPSPISQLAKAQKAQNVQEATRVNDTYAPKFEQNSTPQMPAIPQDPQVEEGYVSYNEAASYVASAMPSPNLNNQNGNMPYDYMANMATDEEYSSFAGNINQAELTADYINQPVTDADDLESGNEYVNTVNNLELLPQAPTARDLAAQNQKLFEREIRSNRGLVIRKEIDFIKDVADDYAQLLVNLNLNKADEAVAISSSRKINPDGSWTIYIPEHYKSMAVMGFFEGFRGEIARYLQTNIMINFEFVSSDTVLPSPVNLSAKLYEQTREEEYKSLVSDPKMQTVLTKLKLQPQMGYFEVVEEKRQKFEKKSFIIK